MSKKLQAYTGVFRFPEYMNSVNEYWVLIIDAETREKAVSIGQQNMYDQTSDEAVDPADFTCVALFLGEHANVNP